MCRTLQGHGHWVNVLALSTDYVMRTGAFDPADACLVHRDVTETGKCPTQCPAKETIISSIYIYIYIFILVSFQFYSYITH